MDKVSDNENKATVKKQRVRRQRSVTELLTSVVLGFESVVIFLAALVMFGLKSLPPVVALAGGWSLALVMLIAVGLLRWRAGIIIGSALQLVVIGLGFVQGSMFFVGILFAAMWAFALISGARLERKGQS
jgi:hypothetical protein